jgi:hypothetical protein
MSSSVRPCRPGCGLDGAIVGIALSLLSVGGVVIAAESISVVNMSLVSLLYTSIEQLASYRTDDPGQCI